MPRPTYDQLMELVETLVRENTELKAHIARQDVRIAELERQLAANSRNSSKPPSSDGLGKPAPKSLRTKTGRKPGGQHGHKGDTLRQITDPDEVIRHEPVCCTGCGAGLARAREVGVARRQIFDLPPATIHVTEHQLITKRCACGTSTRADAPSGVNAPAAYGPRVSAVMVYLYMGQYLSKSRTAHALSELFSIPVSAGTVSAATARAAGDLDEFRTEVTARIIASDVAHFDETGFRAAGALHWLHSASTSLFTLITCHRRRGREAMNAAGILPVFTGIAVHDCWSPYDTYPQLTHSLCNAHLLRELIAVVDHHLAYADDPRSCCWASQVIDSLMAIKDHTDTRAGPADAGLLAGHRRLIVDAAHIRAAQVLPGKVGQKHRALARRIGTRIDDYLRFACDPNAPFDNNAAEREIRMAKLRQKVSGGMRTLAGAEHFAALRSYLATTAKHGIDGLDALTRLATGNPWIPQST
ncbi:MAG: IS66 family transposase [Rhodococcus sp. (in: high G+C Gram-positive bacteria)]